MNQKALEQEMADLGVARYRAKLAKARDKDLETAMPPARRLLRTLLAPYEEELVRWIIVAKEKPGIRHRAVEYIELLPVDVIAAIAARSILDGVASAKLFMRIAMQVAGLLEDEVRFRELEKTDPGLWRELFSRTQQYHGYATKRRHIVHAMGKVEHAFKPWSQPDKAQVGMVLVDLFASVTQLIQIVNRMTIFGKTRTEVHATDKCMEYLESSNARDELLAPVYLPLVVEPRPWTSPMDGGFYSTDLHKRILVKTYDRGYVDELHHIQMPEVLDAVNVIQGTAFRINEKVLDVFRHFWAKNLAVGGLPEKEDTDLPEKPLDIATNEDARKDWRRAAAKVRTENALSRSERIMISKILWVAEKYKGSPLWFASQLDWRSRQYPVSIALHPQGPSLCKGLLLFDKGKRIAGDFTAEGWLYIAAANAFGHDKLSYADRITWAMDNVQMLKDIATDPYDNRDWEDADSPWEALAAAFEISDYLADPDNFVTRLPIHQDATASGLQIMGLLLRCPKTAKATNCMAGDKPRDLYGAVAEKTEEILRERANAGDGTAEWWLDFGITRTACKKPTMTMPYSSTKHSCSKYVREWYLEKAEKTGMFLPTRNFFKPCHYLTCAIWDAMEELLEGATGCMGWLREVAQICCDHDVPIRWTTPMGFPVKQNYTRWNAKVVKTRIGDRIRQHNIRLDTDILERRKMLSGISPNYIHSLDAAAMQKTVLIAGGKGVESFACVHDSFATVAPDCSLLALSIREAYIDIFSTDQLNELRKEVTTSLPVGVELPPLPTYGNFDITSLRSAGYFFT